MIIWCVLQVIKPLMPPLSKNQMLELLSAQALTSPSQKLEFCFGETMASSQLKAS